MAGAVMAEDAGPIPAIPQMVRDGPRRSRPVDRPGDAATPKS
jgi:hypothetical protein